MWIGIDDTDSPKGGCTTWVLTDLIREVTHLDLIGYPRLVRLNPNIPFKTRGNAALAARFGHGRGKSANIGEFGTTPIRSFVNGDPPTLSEADSLFEQAIRVVRNGSKWGDDGTDPAIVMSPRSLPEELYWKAVRGYVTVGEARDAVSATPGAMFASYGSGLGIVGAAAALSWPARRRTWEAIAYRDEERWGTRRRVEKSSVERVSLDFPETFLSVDARTRRLLVAPHTSCPILFGLRSRKKERLGMAIKDIVSEPIERWITFMTNQATGDHLEATTVDMALPGSSPILTGKVTERPVTMPGGHVAFNLFDGSGELPCIAFEPTKTLPHIARRLEPQDTVRVWGSLPWNGKPKTLKLEGMCILRLSSNTEKVANPRCPNCGRSAGSMGKGKGFRCAKCHLRIPLESAPRHRSQRMDMLGAHHPTPSARRHLAPLDKAM